jgi:hypothetical protein
MFTQGAGLNYLLPQWSPPSTGRSTNWHGRGRAARLPTAFVPRRRMARGTSARLRAPDVVVAAAMEPAAERREHPNRCLSSFAWNWPHWSPPSDGGSTGRHGAAGRRHARAAMEPADGRRKHPIGQRGILAIWLPQWSPPLNGGRTSTTAPAERREHQRYLHRAGCPVGAAMGPAIGRREDSNMNTLRRWTEQPQ